ncbi:MAG: hypothetical protein AAFR64_03475 [Pseudomonadota bacterium]
MNASILTDQTSEVEDQAGLQLDLFGADVCPMSMDLGCSEEPTTVVDAKSTGPRLVVVNDSFRAQCDSLPVQLALPELFSADHGKVVRLVSSSHYAAMNRHFSSLARGDRKLRRLAAELARKRCLRVGEVVQLTDAQVLEWIGRDKDGLERIKNVLAGFGLTLGMAAPKWESPGGLISSQW